ncbi:MAG: hypothetical protein HW411_1622, partial [Gammaproteobacteria bacterium]|nr:hypothetical protein [Gammaproteobacteria bacterium]
EHVSVGADTVLRFGRLVAVNASGSELLPLGLLLRAEYFDGTTYTTNSDDGCTALTLAGGIDLSNPQTSGGAPQPGTTAMTVGGGTSSITSGDVALSGGEDTLTFSAPGAGNVGFIDVLVDVDGAGLDHLLYDWDGIDNPAPDGLMFDDNPSGRVTFGIFAGPQEFIYIREPW